MSSPTIEFERHVLRTEAERVDISERDDGWSAECLVCHAWISARNETRRDAIDAFGEHFRSDYPHELGERSHPSG